MALPAVRTVQDSIHGQIPLTAEEAQLLDTPPLQRLRRLRQLSLLHYVFPTAEHSRFSHSLGVLAVAQRIAEQIHRQVPREQFGPDQERLVRLAALLHDVGHLPLSHVGEDAYAALRSRDAASQTGNSRTVLLDRFAVRAKGKGLHEELGALAVMHDESIVSIIGPGLAAQVAELITKDHKHWMCQLVVSSALDADRLDYLVRDSRSVGLNYGLVDVGFLIGSMELCESEIGPVLALSEKALAAAEHYLLARYFHYGQVVQHKTVVALEAVAKALFYRLVEREWLPTEGAVRGYIGGDGWQDYDDASFFNAAARLRRESVPGSLDWALASAVVDRRRPLPIRPLRKMELRPLRHPQPSYEYGHRRDYLRKNREIVAEAAGILPECLSYCESRVRVENVNERYRFAEKIDLEDSDAINEMRNALWIRREDGRAVLLATHPHSIIPHVADTTRYALRAYCVMPYGSDEASARRWSRVEEQIARELGDAENQGEE